MKSAPLTSCSLCSTENIWVATSNVEGVETKFDGGMPKRCYRGGTVGMDARNRNSFALVYATRGAVAHLCECFADVESRLELLIEGLQTEIGGD